jgi:hypothetical protein
MNQTVKHSLNVINNLGQLCQFLYFELENIVTMHFFFKEIILK